MDCEKVRYYMAEYIGQDLGNNLKEEVDRHLSVCDSCFNEVKVLDNTTWQIESDSRKVKTPADFLQGMEDAAAQGAKPHIRIPRRILIASLTAVTAAALIIAFILFVPQNFKYRVYNAATFGKVYSTEYGTFGRKLNIFSTSNNIKITVTKAAADDLQTIIYLKIEGSTANACVIYDEDVLINGKRENNNSRGIAENIGNYSSILILHPVETDSQTLHITINGLHEIFNQNNEKVNGKWSFAVPVKKLKSKTYIIDKTLNLGEDRICFKRLIVGATCTRIEYSFPDYDSMQNNNNKDMLQNMLLMEIEAVNGQKKYNEAVISNINNGQYDTVDFETIYPGNPENFKVNIKKYYKNIMLLNNIEVTVNLKGKFPVEFDYMGNTIKIDNIKSEGSIVSFDLYEPDRPRNYTELSIHPDSEVSMSMESRDYAVVDENNRTYDYKDYLENPEKYEGKSIILYPVKTAITIEYPPGFKNQFKLYIAGYQNIIRANKIMTLK